jgi:hypothetical protein
MVSEESSLESWEINLCLKLEMESTNSFLSFTLSDYAETTLNDEEMTTNSDEMSSFDEESNEIDDKNDVLKEKVDVKEKESACKNYEQKLCEWNCPNRREDFEFYY